MAQNDVCGVTIVTQVQLFLFYLCLLKYMKYLIITLVFVFSLLACSNTEKGNSTLSTSSTTASDSIPAVKTLAQNELEKTLLSDTNIVMIDVRTPSEIKEGYIPGADLFIDYNGGNFENDIQKLDKSKTYIMYCRSGGRSGKASSYMINNGFINVYNLEGGVLSFKGSLVKK
jgi:rhodanese-related sulfurtransferase